MLGVRILPQKHELFAGYLLRLADVNGLTSIEHLLKVIEADKVKCISVVKWTSTELEIILPKLAIALNVTDDVIDHLLTYSVPPFGYDSNREICLDIRITQPRFCIECIKEDGIIDCRYPLSLFSACTKHHQLLINRCPQCGNLFQWNTFIFDGCRKCGLMWVDYEYKNICTFSDLEKNIWSEVIESTEYTVQKVRDIVEAIFAMARPYDTFPDRFYTVPTCQNLNNHIGNAYSLLENQSSYGLWEAMCYQQRHTPLMNNNAVIGPILKLKNRLKHFNLGEKSECNIQDKKTLTKPMTFIESHAFIRLSRAKTLPSKEEDSARFHVNRLQLEKYLGFKEGDLLCSIQFNTLQAVNGTAIARDQIFNLNTLLTQITSTSLDSSSTLADINEFAKMMRMHLCSRSMLINAILLNEVIGHIVLSNKPAQIYVDKISLNDWLFRQFSITCEGNITLQKAARALCCGPERLKSLVTTGKLHYPAWSRSTNEISGESLKAHWHRRHGIPVQEKVIKLA